MEMQPQWGFVPVVAPGMFQPLLPAPPQPVMSARPASLFDARSQSELDSLYRSDSLLYYLIQRFVDFGRVVYSTSPAVPRPGSLALQQTVTLQQQQQQQQLQSQSQPQPQAPQQIQPAGRPAVVVAGAPAAMW